MEFHAKRAHAARMVGLLGVALVLCFASWLTVHLAITAELLRRTPRWPGLLCLLPPLSPWAPHWALRQGMHRRAALWIVSCAGYLALLYAAQR